MFMLRSRTAVLVVLTVGAISGYGFPLGTGSAADSIEILPVPECGFSSEIPAVEDFESLINFSDPYLGNYDAPVTVIEFFDPNCSHCKALHPIMKLMALQFFEDARFFVIPFVIWDYSIPQVEAMYYAAQEGKYYDMLDKQFERQHAGGLTEEEVREIATELEMDADKLISRVNRGMYTEQLLSRREEISNLGVTGTPTILINGRFLNGNSKTTECLTRLIEEEIAAQAE